VYDDESYSELARAMSERIAERARGIVIKTPQVVAENWRVVADELVAVLGSLGIRQSSFVGIGAGASLAEDLALSTPKSVRSLVVIDSPLRPHPSWWERVVDTIEERLPFGLPLRLGSKGFNVRAYAHRLRCPLLTVATRRAGPFVRSELQALGELAPTSWYISVASTSGEEEARELSTLIVEFQDTPAKCPQKNRQEAV